MPLSVGRRRDHSQGAPAETAADAQVAPLDLVAAREDPAVEATDGSELIVVETLNGRVAWVASELALATSFVVAPTE